MFGNKIINDIYGRSLKKETKRQPVSKSQKNEILAQQKSRCAHCRKMLDMRSVEFDHKKEVYKGGRSLVNNLQALCSDCHKIKTHNNRLKKIENKRILDKSYYGEKRNKKECLVILISRFPTYPNPQEQ